jgi:MFS family permease
MAGSVLQRNINALYVIKVSKWFNLVMPIVVLFYKGQGMGMHEVFILKAVYSIAIVALEIPSGYMADIWGKKKTLLFGSILVALGFSVYSVSYGFMAFVFAEIVLGAGQSFISGADSAMLYDSLLVEKKENQYTRQEGRITSAGNFAEAIAGVIGGFIATFGLRLPFFFQAAIAFSAIPASLALVEPAIHKSEYIHSINKLLQFIRHSFVHNTNLRVAVLLSALTGTATLTFAWLAQPFLEKINMPVIGFGITWTLLNLTVGFASAFSYKLEKFLTRPKIIVTIILLISLGFIFSGVTISVVGLAFLFLFYIFRGLASPILKTYVNDYTPSGTRATILSIRDFVIRINFAAIGPLLGYMTDNLSLSSAFMIAGVIYLAGAFWVVVPWLKKSDRQP